MCVCSFNVLYLFSLKGGSTQALIVEYLLTKLLQIGSPFYHLTSNKKSALIQKPSAKTPKPLLIMEREQTTLIIKFKEKGELFSI